MKSAYAAFEEEQMPIIKAENPNLRQSQLKQQLQKRWKKSPDNPMNQAHIAHDATRDEARAAAETLKNETLEQFKNK
jgi:Coiled-coil domain-containing protein 124 /Oxs1